jgi:hypothetical protein
MLNLCFCYDVQSPHLNLIFFLQCIRKSTFVDAATTISHFFVDVTFFSIHVWILKLYILSYCFVFTYHLGHIITFIFYVSPADPSDRHKVQIKLFLFLLYYSDRYRSKLFLFLLCVHYVYLTLS